MRNKFINPRKKLENETEKEYKTYLRNFYFEVNKPCPQTRYEFAYSEKLPDVPTIMDGEDGAYTKYLDKFYQDYYKALENQVNLAFHMSNTFIPKNSIKTKVVNVKEKIKTKIVNRKEKIKTKIVNRKEKIKTRIANVEEKIETGITNFKNKNNERIKKVEAIAMLVLSKTLVFGISLITVASLISFFIMKRAMGLITGVIGGLALIPLVSKDDVDIDSNVKKKENSKIKSALKTFKEKLVNVFSMVKTDTEWDSIVEENEENRPMIWAKENNKIITDGTKHELNLWIEGTDDIVFDTAVPNYQEDFTSKETKSTTEEIVEENNTNEVEYIQTNSNSTLFISTADTSIFMHPIKFVKQVIKTAKEEMTEESTFKDTMVKKKVI